MQETREDRKRRLSAKASHAVQVRWDRYHAECPAPEYNQHHAYGAYEITTKSIRTGRVNVLYLHEDSDAPTAKLGRRDNFYAELNGLPWKPERVSLSDVTKIIRKNIVKTKSGRVV